MRSIRATAMAMLCVLGSGAVHAASLRVAPTTLTLIAPDSAATLTLSNEDMRPINVQIRIFRWSQTNGVEHLEPTTDVVVSPPSTALGPRSLYVVRVVRVTRTPVAGEESYRVVVDELPDRSRRMRGTVTFVLRYAIPVFFASRDAGPPQVAWTVQPSNRAVVLTARNTGGRRLRVADLKLSDAGRIIAVRDGLLGYVLAGATMRWSLPRAGSEQTSGHSVTVAAQGEAQAIHATATVHSAR
jgi:fimbrial chaperone protein